MMMGGLRALLLLLHLLLPRLQAGDLGVQRSGLCLGAKFLGCVGSEEISQLVGLGRQLMMPAAGAL
jgi:hypothetical protein